MNLPKVLTEPREVFDHIRACHNAEPRDRWVLCCSEQRQGNFVRLLGIFRALAVPVRNAVSANLLVQVVGAPPMWFQLFTIPKADLPKYLLAAIFKFQTGEEFPEGDHEDTIAFPGSEAESLFIGAVLDASLNPETVSYGPFPDPLSN